MARRTRGGLACLAIAWALIATACIPALRRTPPPEHSASDPGEGAKTADAGAAGADGAASTGESATAQSSPAAVSYKDRVTLGIDDVFQVRVYMENDMTGDYRVGPDGRIAFPLIGDVEVLGRSPVEIEEEIRTRLADGYLKNPDVTVFLKELNSKKIFVFGQVKEPGTFRYENGMSIIHAVTLAGGFAERADKSRTNVTRIVAGRETRVTIPVDSIVEGRSKNYLLRPGDIIFVPESFF